MASPTALVPFAALEVHYMLHGGFMRRGQLLDDVGAIRDHRIHIVHGRNDAVCPAQPPDCAMRSEVPVPATT